MTRETFSRRLQRDGSDEAVDNGRREVNYQLRNFQLRTILADFSSLRAITEVHERRPATMINSYKYGAKFAHPPE